MRLIIFFRHSKTDFMIYMLRINVDVKFIHLLSYTLEFYTRSEKIKSVRPKF